MSDSQFSALMRCCAVIALLGVITLIVLLMSSADERPRRTRHPEATPMPNAAQVIAYRQVLGYAVIGAKGERSLHLDYAAALQYATQVHGTVIDLVAAHPTTRPHLAGQPTDQEHRRA